MSACRRSNGGVYVFLCAVTVAICVNGAARCNGYPAAQSDSKFSVSSSAFEAGAVIPTRFTCSGDNLSPALAWTDPPAGTQSFVLIVDDPDAPGGVFTHWVIFNLAPSLRQLPEGQKGDPDGARQGRNGFDQRGYGGPCPPPGHVHRYYFRLYALNEKLDLPGGASKSAVEKAMKGHVVAQAELMGKFSR